MPADRHETTRDAAAGRSPARAGVGDDPWPTTLDEARAVQEVLRHRVVASGDLPPPRRIAGVDVHFGAVSGLAWGAVAVLDGESLELVESALAAVPAGMPYVPGYLSFRETPAALAALAMLREPPDLLMVDGQGIAHPRRFGIACHIGVLVDIPAIGVAKSLLVGRHEEPAAEAGHSTPLLHRREVIGRVVRTRDGVRPLFVSAGHRIGLERAVELVLATTRGRRLPEPTRIADLLSRAHPP
ncbi:MAG TPA: deoxyribonuclease V [Geminicoccaceae bacterium]